MSKYQSIKISKNWQQDPHIVSRETLRNIFLNTGFLLYIFSIPYAAKVWKYKLDWKYKLLKKSSEKLEAVT